MNTIPHLENLKSISEDSLTEGQIIALDNYKESIRHGSDKFEITSLPFEDEHIPDFVETLRKSEIKDVTITVKHMEIISFLHSLNDLGCEMIGLDVVNWDFNAEKYKRKGIKVKL